MSNRGRKREIPLSALVDRATALAGPLWVPVDRPGNSRIQNKSLQGKGLPRFEHGDMRTQPS